jgi:phosphoglycolate phosphatase-like HAD superfamily hydrolase
MAMAIIFDIDGTLIDSVDAHARAWQDAFRDFGHDIAFDEIRQQIGKGGDQLMPVFLAQAEIDAREAARKAHVPSVGMLCGGVPGGFLAPDGLPRDLSGSNRSLSHYDTSPLFRRDA